MSHSIDHIVIVSGGVGSRLATISEGLPKALVQVGDKPVLQHQLELAAASGIGSATVFAGYGAGRILDFVGDGRRFGLRAQVVVEAEPRGTAGAVLGSLATLPNDFFVVYGDIMLGLNLQRLAQRHLESGAEYTAVVHPNDHPQDSDLVETDACGWITAIHSCPHPPGKAFGNLVNAAVYVVRRDALSSIATTAGKQDFVKDVMAHLLRSGSRVLAYRTSEYVKDMGTPERLRQVDADWRAGRCALSRSLPNRPAIFLDRDGTLNTDNGHLRTSRDLELIPGAAGAIAALRHAGFLLVVLTNQPVIARGEASEADVDTIHRRLEWELGIRGAYLDAIYVCPHHPDAGFAGERSDLKVSCDCRKPATGLFERACRDLQIDAERSWMIGDQTRDIEMARRARLRSILVRTGSAGLDGRFPTVPDYIVNDMAAAADVILQRHHQVAS